ncbi:MAG TPA: type II CAAX endopeptidase family protein [Sedimentisphaerales bacterium]|nr:type II CAAX endopeptidase family protein [Sedimentisphaerales bacterium]
MGYQSGQLSIVNSPPTVESVPLFTKGLKRYNISLLTETSLVTIAAILAVRLLATSSISRAAWFVSPAILIAASLIPTAIRRAEFPKIGLNVRQIGPTVLVVCRTCVVVFSVLFAGLWLLKSFGLGLPLQPVQPKEQGWISWLFYQFMYVAVAEEVFFRGYVQRNILMLANPSKDGQYRLWKWLSIVLSAACFAVAHIIIQGSVILALTFLPGLICGWLFIRTRSLLAPILFHGLANTCYCVMAGTFM